MREKDSETNNPPASSSSSSSSSPSKNASKNEAHKKKNKLSKTATAVLLPCTFICSLTLVPAKVVIASASVLGFGTSVGLLKAAYTPAMNRCRCHLKSEKQWLAESASRSASMVSLESFAQRSEAYYYENENSRHHGKRKERSAGLHCQRCLKRTQRGVRVSFLTSPPLVGFASGAIAFGLRAVGAFALRRGGFRDSRVVGAASSSRLADAQPKTWKQKKKKNNNNNKKK